MYICYACSAEYEDDQDWVCPECGGEIWDEAELDDGSDDPEWLDDDELPPVDWTPLLPPYKA